MDVLLQNNLFIQLKTFCIGWFDIGHIMKLIKLCKIKKNWKNQLNR